MLTLRICSLPYPRDCGPGLFRVNFLRPSFNTHGSVLSPRQWNKPNEQNTVCGTTVSPQTAWPPAASFSLGFLCRCYFIRGKKSLLILPQLSYPTQGFHSCFLWPNSIPLVIPDQLIPMYKTLWTLVISEEFFSCKWQKKQLEFTRPTTRPRAWELYHHLTRRPKEGELRWGFINSTKDLISHSLHSAFLHVVSGSSKESPWGLRVASTAADLISSRIERAFC